MVNGFTFLASDPPTTCEETKRDDLSVVPRTVRGGDVSCRDIALVERVEALVAVAFDFALDDIVVEIQLVPWQYCAVKRNAGSTRESRASHVIAIRTRARARPRLSPRGAYSVQLLRATQVPRPTKTVITQCHPPLAAASPSP